MICKVSKTDLGYMGKVAVYEGTKRLYVLRTEMHRLTWQDALKDAEQLMQDLKEINKVEALDEQ